VKGYLTNQLSEILKLKFLLSLLRLSNFCNFVIDTFTKKNGCMELKFKV